MVIKTSADIYSSLITRLIDLNRKQHKYFQEGFHMGIIDGMVGHATNTNVDEAKAVDLELSPGQMSLHHVGIVHGSNPNKSNKRRVGFAVRYIASHVRQTLGPRDFAT